MSGVDFDGRQLRKGAADAVRKHWSRRSAGVSPSEVQTNVDTVARRGSTPLVVAEGTRVLGVIELKDIVKGGIKERFAELRRMGIKTVMITGDNRLTAAAIAAEAGVDDFLAEATPEAKLKLIRDHQAQGRLVAMTGDGTNDAPALAQADVAVAMNTGTQAAKEAGNMVDLDSNPDQADRGRRDRQADADDARARSPRSRSRTTSPSTSRSFRPRSRPPIRGSDALNMMGLATPQSRDPVRGHLQRAGHRRR